MMRVCCVPSTVGDMLLGIASSCLSWRDSGASGRVGWIPSELGNSTVSCPPPPWICRWMAEPDGFTLLACLTLHLFASHYLLSCFCVLPRSTTVCLCCSLDSFDAASRRVLSGTARAKPRPSDPRVLVCTHCGGTQYLACALEFVEALRSDRRIPSRVVE